MRDTKQNKPRKGATDQMQGIASELVHLARLALAGRTQDVRLHLRRVAKKYQGSFPELSGEVVALLRDSPTRSSPIRKHDAPPIPVDQDSRLQLVRYEARPDLEVEPILDSSVKLRLDQLVSERKAAARLMEAGLAPTRSVLLTGPPGVGKSLTARWIARELGLPLLTLDLSAVMSSFLGRTGNNLRFVLDYAKSTECVLLLDELDAIAKRRDDATEVGELKLPVTVLLQEIDDWPAEGLLVAATNHPGLLDPAVWRRFELKVDFQLPDAAALRKAIAVFMGTPNRRLNGWQEVLSSALLGASFSDVERELSRVRRAHTLGSAKIEDLLAAVVANHLAGLSRKDRSQVTARLVSEGKMSAREVSRTTGVSRDTIRKALESSGRS